MTPTKVRLSIALATYNGARFIREQLDSFARQTRLPDELVVTDDGSTDGTPELVEEFALTAPFPVTLHRNPQNLGFKDNFGKAIALCSGDIIFLSDQDDVWLPEKLAAVEKHFNANPSAQVVINDAFLTDATLGTAGHTQRAKIRKGMGSDRYFFTGCCSAHRRLWHKLALPIPGASLAHDQWLNCLAIEVGCADHMDDVLQYFRRHGGNLSNSPLSEPTGFSFWRTLRETGLADARDGWRRRIELLRQFIARLRERPATASAHGWDRKIPGLEREIASLEERIALCSTPRWPRAPKVIGFWARGGYREATGWKSAAKDLIRP